MWRNSALRTFIAIQSHKSQTNRGPHTALHVLSKCVGTAACGEALRVREIVMRRSGESLRTPDR